ncbi:MAG: ribosome small subunit-dependent GTPase A [Pleomorphochaeta sp.]
MIGRIIRGINNIYNVEIEERVFECRIKGKLLNDVSGEYNPLAVGDFVEFEKINDLEGLIIKRLPRKNSFQRWNMKGQCNQTVVANMDLIVCVTSCSNPPFRPRFIDRVIACSQNVEILLVLNKCDFELTEYELERFNLFESLGYDTVLVSAKERTNIDELISKIENKIVAFVGQSGVGKSTLINQILGTEQRTNEISEKYDRGRHTTNYSLLLRKDNITIVDTPGVREIMVPHRDPVEIANSFPEFVKNKDKCAFSMCSHTNEPDCEIKRMVENDEINYDRYESYLRMIESLSLQGPKWKGSSNSTSKARYKMPKKKKK